MPLDKTSSYSIKFYRQSKAIVKVNEPADETVVRWLYNPVEIRPYVHAALDAGTQNRASLAPSKQNEAPDRQARSKGPKLQGAG